MSVTREVVRDPEGGFYFQLFDTETGKDIGQPSRTYKSLGVAHREATKAANREQRKQTDEFLLREA